jgi:sugar/nucleoside kinase (ribokinase family)
MALFTSMGMFIMDEIHFSGSSNLKSQFNVVGGGGTYGALGARVVTTSKRSKQIGWIIDKGYDFSDEVESYLRKWDTGAIWRQTPNRLTTRGWNMYGERELRDFKYLAPKLRIDVEDLIQYQSLLCSQSYHLICSPERCLQILTKLEKERQKHDIPPPIITWEPVPDLCTPEHLSQCLENLQRIQVLTPNAEEASRFFNGSEPTTKRELEVLASRFLPYLTSDSKYKTGSGIVLRCGALGCFTLTTNGISKWFPAYHNHLSQSIQRVIDPTGGGNTFIGSFTTGFILSKGDWEVASICGNIGAGIAIEQIGMPKYEDDKWNGLSLEQRVNGYIQWNDLDYDKNHIMRALQQF